MQSYKTITHPATASYMSKAALVRPGVLSDNAERLMCQTLRSNIYAVLGGPMFTRAELFAAKMKNVRCHDAATLQRRYAAAQRIRRERETACQWAAEAGGYTTGLDQTDAEFRQQEMNECDLDAA